MKISFQLPKFKGSIVSYSLIILFVMLSIAVGITTVGIQQKKNASSTEFSTQALQTADTGSSLAVKKLKDAAQGTLVANLYGETASCANGTITGNTVPGGGAYELTFYKDVEGTSKSSCGDLASEVKSLKSVGKFHDTVSVANVAMAASLDCSIKTYGLFTYTAGTSVIAYCTANTDQVVGGGCFSESGDITSAVPFFTVDVNTNGGYGCISNSNSKLTAYVVCCK